MKFISALHVLPLIAGLGMAAYAEVPTLGLAHGTDPSMVIRVDGQDAEAETVRLLTGIGEVRADLKLELLSQQEGMQGAGDSFLGQAQQVLPGIADGLAAAGAPDVAPMLQALGAAKGDAVKDAYHDVEAGLLKARSALAPSSGAVLQSVVALTRAAAERIDPAAPTSVGDYQMAWALLMVARGELDLLARDQDRAVATQAAEKGMAMDDLILFMPDPNQSTPVAFDRALILELIETLERSAKDA